jgi:hypothetical protein
LGHRLGQVAVHPGRLEFFLASAQVNLLLRLPSMVMTCMLPGCSGCADAASAITHSSRPAPSTAAVDADHRAIITTIGISLVVAAAAAAGCAVRGLLMDRMDGGARRAMRFSYSDWQLTKHSLHGRR